MELKEQLLFELSKRNAGYIADFIGNDPELFDKLAELIFNSEYPVQLRASWVLCTVTDRHPGLLTPYLSKIVENLTGFNHTGIHRNLLRQIAQIEIPAYLQGVLYDICLKWLYSKNEPPAVKVHCMKILYNIAVLEPDLKRELTLVLEDFTETASPAISNRAGHLFEKLMTND